MSKYFIEFKNKTGLGQYSTFCVFQQMNDSEYIDSVAWLVTSVPGGSTSTVSWKIGKYMVALAEYRLKGHIGIYHTKQSATAEIGSSWQIINYDGKDSDTQTLVPLSSGSRVEPDTIKITNNSTSSANCGVGMWGGTTAFERNVQRNSTSVFKIKPQYWVGVFDIEIQRGQVIEDNALTSKPISFPSDKNLAIVTAMAENGKVVLTVEFGERTSDSYFRSLRDF
ncbi:9460_t:CDS:2, partial [Cetraspora pellucida]